MRWDIYLVMVACALFLLPTAFAEPFFSDDFDNGQRNNANGFEWLSNRHTEVSNQLSHSGSHSLKFTYGGYNPTHIWAEQSYDLGRDVTELWVEFYVYFPDGTEGIPGVAEYVNTNPQTEYASNNKFHTHWTAQLGNEGSSRAGYSQGYHTYEIWASGGGDGNARMYHRYNEVDGLSSRPGGDIPILNDDTRGRWVRWRQYARFNTGYDTTDGISETWIDDTKIETVTGLNFNTNNGYSLYWRYGYLMGWDNSGFDQPTAVYIDSVKFYDEDPGWGGSSDVLHPNLPSGFVEIGRNDGSVRDIGGVALGIDGFSFWYHNPENVAVVADPDNPTGSGSALRFFWPAGSRSGSAAGTFATGPVSELYIMYRVVIESGGWDAGHKWFYLRAVGQDQWGAGVWTAHENDDTLRVIGGLNHVLVDEYALFARDTELAIEYLFVAESSAGAEDGEVHIWVNGVKIAENFALRMAGSGYTPLWTDIQLYNTANSVPTDSAFRLRELYLAGRLPGAAECVSGQTRSCGSDVGACVSGTQMCNDGSWGSCVGAVGPSLEVCDGLDNDCDGVIDEGGVCPIEPDPDPEYPVVSVSSSYSGYSSSVLVDGVVDADGGTATTWASADNGGPHWVEFDFGEVVSLSEFTLHWAFNNQQSRIMTSQQVDVQLWDGSSWATVGSHSYASDEDSSSVSFAESNAQRWRLFQPVNMGSPAYSSVLWLTEIDYALRNATVRPGGDVNEDGVVNIEDLLIIVANFRRSPQHSSFDVRADRNGDGVVNVFDLVLVAREFGQSVGDPELVDGLCGDRATTYSSVVSSWPQGSSYCAAGIASGSPLFPSSGSSVSWDCEGSGGGSTASCSASQSAPSNPYSNEPAGMSEIFHADGTSKAYGGLASESNVVVVSDAEAPNGQAVEWRWPNGAGAGAAAAYYVPDFDGGGVANIGPVREIYYRMVMKWNPDWDGHGGGDKLMYFGHVGQSSGYFLSLRGEKSNGMQSMTFQNQAPNVGPSSFFLLNNDAGIVPLGEYVTIEVHMVAQSSASASDGEMHVWVNGEPISLQLWDESPLSGTAMRWVTSGDVRFEGFQWYPYWGGNDGPTKGVFPYDWVRFGELYVSGKV